MKTKPKTKPAAKKTVSRLLALLLALITVFSTVATVSAAHSDDEFTDAKTGMTVRRLYTTKAKNASGNYFSLFYGCNPYTDSGNWPIVGGTKFADEMSAAGKDSHDYGTKGGAQWFYCIHYGPLAYSEHTTTDQTIATANAYWNGLSDAQRRGVMLALSCGFPNVADVYFNAEGYAATQLIIWEFTNGGRTTPFQTSGWGTSTAIRSYNGSKFKDAYDAILKTMATRCLTPTFVDSSSNKNVTTISTDTTTVTLKGTGYENGVLLKTGSSKPYYRFGTGASDYSSYSENLAINMNNWTVSKNGLNVEVRDTNNLYVWADAGYEGKTVSATLKRNISGNGGWVTLAGSQELVTGVPKVDISFKLQANVEIIKGTATLKKTSASGEIEGYKFTISNNHDGKWDTVYGISDSNGNIYRAVPSNTNDAAHSSWTAVTENGSKVYTFKDLVDGTYHFREWCGDSNSFPTQVTVKVYNKNNTLVQTEVFQGSDLKEDTADSNQGNKGDCTFGGRKITGLTGGGRMEITINNEKNTSTMSMVKQSDSGDVAGYIFAVKNNNTGVTIYGKSDSSGNIYKINKNGNSYTTTGTYTFEGMSSGSYTFTEYIPDGKKVNLESWAVEVYVNGITADYNKLSTSSFASNGTVTLNGTKYTAYTLKTPCQIRYLETDGARLKLTIKNAKQPEYGWAELYKVASSVSSDPGTPLSGAKFEIKDSSGAVIPNAISEVSTGYYKTIALPVGDYTIRETKAPKTDTKQYNLDPDTYRFTIVANDTQRIANTTYDGERVFANDELYGSRLLKTVAGGKGTVEGFKFILRQDSKFYLKTDASGNAYITDSSFNGNNGTVLNGITYDDCGYLIEKATPGYSMSEITITIKNENDRPVFVGTYGAGETNGNCEQFKVTSSRTYDGIQLQSGDYLIEFDKFMSPTANISLTKWWQDFAASAGWEAANKCYLVIEIENAPDDSKTTIKKTMPSGSTGDLEGYCFELTDMSDRDHPIYGRTDEDGNAYLTDANYTKHTGLSESAYTITGLDDGSYTFVEQPHPDHPSAYPSSVKFYVTPAGGTRKLVKAFTAAQCAAARQPNGSCVLTGINITGLTAGGKLEIEVENSESAANITKLVSDNSQNLDGWRFRLANTATGKAVYGLSDHHGNVYQTDASFTEITNLTRESFIFRDLTDGTYTFQEYGSSKYPAYRPTSVKIYVTKAGSTTRTLVKEFNQAACEAARRYKNGGYYWLFSGIELTGLTGGGKLEIEITNTPYGTFWVHKVDEDDKYDLADAEFDIYDIEGKTRVGHMGPTDADGYAQSPVLPYGTYQIVETVFPKNYPQKPGVSYQWTVVVSADSGKKDNAKELPNKSGIGLIKVTKLDEKYRPLAKVYFTVRNADNPTKVYPLGPTDANGCAEVAVPYGNYVVVESKTVPGYEISLTEYKGTVSEDTDWEFSFTAVNYPKMGYIEVYKKTQDGKDLAGAVFSVYDENGNFLTQTGETDDSGYARTSDEDGLYYNQTYTVKETKFPDNYQPAGNQVTAIDTPAWNVMVYNFKLVLTGGKANAAYTVSKNGTVITTVTADEYGKATTDALDSGTYTVTQDGSAGSYTVTVAPAPTWTVPLNEDTAPNGFYHIDAVNALEQAQIEVLKTTPDGKKLSGAEFTIYDNNDGTIADKITTDSKGYGISKPLDMGTYRVVETKFPANCTSSGTTEWNVTLSSTTTTERIYHIDAVNIPYGSVKVIKEAEDHFKSGFKFRLYGGEIDITKTTDETGTVVFEKIPIGTYTISEVDTDIRYVVPSDQNKTVKWGEETTATFENELKKFRVVLTKTDVETSVAQGDATLKGAVYGIYKNGKLVDTYETDANGGFTTEYYDCGTDWTVKEIKPSEGYLLDPTVYPVGAEAKLFTLERNDVPVNATEQVIKGQIKLIKTYENGREPEVKPELNATFEVYLKSAGSYEKAKETERDLLICDADGVATSKKLPYGTYVVHQITGDDSALLVVDFEVEVFENEKLYSYELHDKAVLGTVSIVKKDAETGEVIPYKGVFIQILDLTTNQLVTYFDETTNKTIDTFETDESGVCYVPVELPYGAYRVTEVRAPKGYLLNDKPVDFTVTRDHATAEVILYDKPAKGSITVEKVGEMFATVTEKDGIYQPVYELQGLEGATFEIRAAEDISTLDGTERHSKGDLVATITTGRDGKATATDLYLGSYTITEIAAPDEMVLNTQPQTVTLTYNEETATANVLDDVVIENDRQKVSITLHKEMEKDERFAIGMDGEVENVSFGIYAAEEITAADETVIPKDGLLEVVYCNADGDAVFTTDLPINAAYYVKEVSTDDHYQVTDATYPVYFEYQGQEVAVVEIELEEVINTLIRGDISGRKLDEDGAPLAGVLFGLFRDDESVFTEETAFLTVESDENGEFSFTDIPYGSYVVRELRTADERYALNTELYPVVVDGSEEEPVEIEIVNHLIRGTAMTIKVDAEYPENRLTGATFEIYSDVDGNKEFDAEIDTLIGEMTETETGVYTRTELLYGGYFLYEKEAPKNFVKDDGYYYFEITQDGETVEVENEAGVGFLNHPVKVPFEITKTDVADGKPLPNAGFRIKDEEGNVVVEGRTDENGIATFELRVGKYTYEEFDAPKGYLIDTTPHAFEIKANDEIVKAAMTNEKAPITGDSGNIQIWLTLCFSSMAALLVLFVLRRKLREEQK